MIVGKLIPLLHVLFFPIVLPSTIPLSPSNKSGSLSKHPVILLVSFDGFRHDYLGKVPTPMLDSIKENGVYVPYMEPVFPTVTFTNHQTMITGLYAEDHGIVHNIVFDPLYNKSLSGFQDDEGFWNYDENVLPIWLYNEMAGDGRVSGAYMWPGSSSPYGKDNDLFPTYYISKYNISVPWEERVEAVISWMTNEEKPANLVFLYFNEPDTKGHAFGPNSEETLSEVTNADSRTAYLVDKLKEVDIFDKINLIITSDHGMAAVTEERIINLTSFVDQELVALKYGYSPILQFQPKEGKLEELYQGLRSHSEDRPFTVWKKEDMSIYPFYYNNSRRIMDVVVVANPRYAFDDFQHSIKDFNREWNLWADPTREYGLHGYGNLNDEMQPIFMAQGPNFRRNYTHDFIANRDIVPLISKILNITEPPNYGRLDNVIDMIVPQEGLPSSTYRTTSTTEGSANNLRIPALFILQSLAAVISLNVNL